MPWQDKAIALDDPPREQAPGWRAKAIPLDAASAPAPAPQGQPPTPTPVAAVPSSVGPGAKSPLGPSPGQISRPVTPQPTGYTRAEYELATARNRAADTRFRRLFEIMSGVSIPIPPEPEDIQKAIAEGRQKAEWQLVFGGLPPEDAKAVAAFPEVREHLLRKPGLAEQPGLRTAGQNTPYGQETAAILQDVFKPFEAMHKELGEIPWYRVDKALARRVWNDNADKVKDAYNRLDLPAINERIANLYRSPSLDDRLLGSDLADRLDALRSVNANEGAYFAGHAVDTLMAGLPSTIHAAVTGKSMFPAALPTQEMAGSAGALFAFMGGGGATMRQLSVGEKAAGLTVAKLGKLNPALATFNVGTKAFKTLPGVAGLLEKAQKMGGAWGRLLNAAVEVPAMQAGMIAQSALWPVNEGMALAAREGAPLGEAWAAQVAGSAKPTPEGVLMAVAFGMLAKMGGDKGKLRQELAKVPGVTERQISQIEQTAALARAEEVAQSVPISAKEAASRLTIGDVTEIDTGAGKKPVQAPRPPRAAPEPPQAPPEAPPKPAPVDALKSMSSASDRKDYLNKARSLFLSLPDGAILDDGAGGQWTMRIVSSRTGESRILEHSFTDASGEVVSNPSADITLDAKTDGSWRFLGEPSAIDPKEAKIRPTPAPAGGSAEDAQSVIDNYQAAAMALREAEDEFAREGQRNPYDEAIDRFKKAGAKLADLLPPKGTAPSEMTDVQRLAWEYNERNVTSTLNAMLGTIADRASEEAGEELTPKRVGNVRPSPVPPEAAAPAPAGEVAPEPAPEPPAPSAPGESPRQGSLMRELGARPKLTAKEDAPPRIEVAPIEGGEPKYSGDIILDLSESVGKPIKKAATGRFLGMYEPGQAKTSIKFQGDLDTTAHEIAHALDDQFAIMGEWARPGARSPFDEELATFWWHGSAKKSGPRAKLQYKRAEGVAEYLRAWMLNPEAAEKQAPKFTDFIKGKVPGKVMAKLASFGTKVRQYAGLSAVDQMRSQIRMGPEPSRIAKALKEFHLERWRGVKNVATSIYHWGVNRFYNDIEPVFRAYREARVRRGKEAPGPWVDAELSIRRIRGDSLEWGNQFLKGPMDLAESVKAGSPRRAKGVGGIEWITETLDKSGTKPYNRDLHDLSVLLTSQKTVELAGSVYKELGGKIAEMDRRIALAEDAGDAKAVASLETRKARLEQQARFRVGRLTGAGAGLYSDVKVAEDAIHELAADPKRMDALREAAKRYRAFADASLKMLVDSGRITPERYDAIRAENQFYSNMQVVMDDILTPGVRGTGGKAMGTSRETIHQRHGSTRRKTDPILSMIDQGYKMYHEARRSMALNQFYEPFRTGRGMYEGKPIDLADLGAKARASDENTITNYHNGKAEYWTHPPDIYKALKKWGVDVRLPWVLTAPARVLRWCVIHFPGFAARNLIRDTVTRIVISNREHPFHNLLPQADVEGFTAQDLYELSGASATGHYLQGPRQYYRMMQRSVRHLVKQNVIVAGAKEIGAAYMNLLEGSETLGRMREFKSTFAEGKKKGMNDLDAMAFAAGESRGLMDFAQMGSVMRWVNQVVPFSNAQIQGLVRTGASAKKHPGRFLARWGMYVLAPTLLEYAWNSTTNKKEWEALPAWQKDMFWNIKIGSYWLAIPKPFEMGVLASGVSRAIDQVSGNMDAFRGYLGSVAKSFLPVDESALLAGIAPSVIETAANYDFFRGKSIVPDWEKNLPVEYRQGTENASRLGKALAAVIPTDPRFLDHIIWQQFGGLGGMALRASDVGKREPESLPMYVTGLIRMPPGLSSVPVDKLRGLMRTYRLGTNKALRPFQDALSDYFAAQGTSAKDAAARRLREIAEALMPAAEAMAEEAKVKLQWKKDHPGEQLPEAPEDRVDKMLKLPTSPSLKMPKGPYD